LRPESLAVESERHVEIADFTAMPVERALKVAREIKLADRKRKLRGRVSMKLSKRLQFLERGRTGLHLARPLGCDLSGGEGQRHPVATQIGSKLRECCTCWNEPSIGLHHRDNGRLLNALENLRDLGNTVLVVEHVKKRSGALTM